MTNAAPAPLPTHRPAGGARARDTVRSRRWLLPLSGAAAVALGFSVWAAGPPGEAYAPLLLAALGAGLLLGGGAYVRGGSAIGVAAPTGDERYIADSLVICPSCSARSYESRTTDGSIAAAWRIPSSWSADPFLAGDGRGMDPGDPLGGAWAATIEPFPTVLLGLTFTSLPSAPRPEAYGPTGGSLPAHPAVGPRSGPSTTWDRSGGHASPFPARPPVPGALPGAAPGPAPEATIAGGGGSFRESRARGSAVPDPILGEALNPVPPHLRSLARSPGGNGTDGRFRPQRAAPDGPCADCRAPVLDPAPWRRCVDCRRPLCADCVIRALLTRDRARCPECAAARERAP